MWPMLTQCTIRPLVCAVALVLWRHVGVALALGWRHVDVKGERHRVRVCMWDAGYSLHANMFKP